MENKDLKETAVEWQPKRGDRVLVWDENENKAEKRIFLAEIKGCVSPIVTVPKVHEVYFKNNETFGTTQYKHMKPIPTEQPKETTSISLENWIRNKLQEQEEMQDYSIATETVRVLLDKHKEMYVKPTEADFKSKVVELIEKRIERYKECEKWSLEMSDEHDAIEYKAIANQFKDFLNQIKQLQIKELN